MASSRAFTLILLLVSFNLCESMWEKLDKVKEQVDVALHRKNPETIVRACGDQLLALLMEIDTSRCPHGRNRRAAGDERVERRRLSISHHCCRVGCSYESLCEMCAHE